MLGGSCTGCRDRGFAVAVGSDDVRKLASLGCALALLCEVGALPDVLLVAVKTLFAIAEHSEVAAYAFSRPNVDMGEGTIGTCASAIVGEVHTKRRAFWRRVV